jgi:hypothetical protein
VLDDLVSGNENARRSLDRRAFLRLHQRPIVPERRKPFPVQENREKL